MIRCDHSPVSQICAAYDQEGVVFGVYTDDFMIRMYDARNYQEGPFAKFSLYENSITSVLDPLLVSMQLPNLNVKKLHATDLKFSPDGNQLLVATNRGVFLHLDAFEGNLQHILYQHMLFPSSSSSSQQQQQQREKQKKPTEGLRLGACYTADGAFVATGSDDGRIHFYKSSTGQVVHTSPRGHATSVVDLQFNPQRHLLASVGGNSTVLWTPAV